VISQRSVRRRPRMTSVVTRAWNTLTFHSSLSFLATSSVRCVFDVVPFVFFRPVVAQSSTSPSIAHPCARPVVRVDVVRVNFTRRFQSSSCRFLSRHHAKPPNANASRLQSNRIASHRIASVAFAFARTHSRSRSRRSCRVVRRVACVE